MKIVAAIQARLGSTRLPGKVLKPLFGKPMLQHIMERVGRSNYLAEMVIICPMKDFTEISGAVPKVKVLANSDVSDEDLVGRYWHAALSFGAGLMVRVCADNPCVDAQNIDLLIQEYIDNLQPKKDIENVLRTNAGDAEGSTWPMSLGAELYPFYLLRDMDLTIPSNFREHPHLGFHIVGRVKEPPCPYKWMGPLRFDVNDQEDFEKAETIYKHFGNNEFSTQELLDYYV